LYGAFLEPKRLKQKRFEAQLSRHSHLDEKIIEKHLQEYEEKPPKSVGAFQKHNNSTIAILFVPEDAFALVMQNAECNKINFMTLRGQTRRYGRGNIYSFSLLEELDEYDNRCGR
jgi:hypothetical protein